MVKVEVKIKGVNTLFDVDKLEKLEDGLFADNYNDDGTIDILSENINLNNNRINSIKAKAGQIITSKYDIIKQMNIFGEGGDKQVEMVAWIKKIRDISNKAEQDGTALADIIWE